MAILWLLNSSGNYLDSVGQINIFTDDKPLSYTVSDNNLNANIT